jgi:RNA polymerase sigma-70 factor (ECF subfamily)
VTDGELIAGVEEHYDSVYRFARRLLGNPEEARDVTQEAFLRLAGERRPLPGEAVKRWLFTVVRNLCIDLLRKQSRHRAASIESAENDLSPSRGEAIDAVRDAVARLDVDHREVLILREFEGMTYAEIAAVLGCPEGTVKSRIARARTLLRDLLVEYREAAR